MKIPIYTPNRAIALCKVYIPSCPSLSLDCVEIHDVHFSGFFNRACPSLLVVLFASFFFLPKKKKFSSIAFFTCCMLSCWWFFPLWNRWAYIIHPYNPTNLPFLLLSHLIYSLDISLHGFQGFLVWETLLFFFGRGNRHKLRMEQRQANNFNIRTIEYLILYIAVVIRMVCLILERIRHLQIIILYYMMTKIMTCFKV